MGSNAIPNAPAGGGSTSPGGSTGEIQFNNAGAFAGDPNLNWIPSTETISIGTESTAFGRLYFRSDTVSGTNHFGVLETRQDPITSPIVSRYGMCVCAPSHVIAQNYVACIDIGTDSFGRGQTDLYTGGSAYGSLVHAISIDYQGVVHVLQGFKYEASAPFVIGYTNYPDATCKVQISADGARALTLTTSPYNTYDVLNVTNGASGATVSGISHLGILYLGSFPTASRPAVSTVGSVCYDKTISKPIFWDGTVWRDAMANAV